MTFSDTEMKELGKSTQINIYNTRSLIRALKYVSDILQTEEAFTMEEYTHTHTHTHAETHTHTHAHTNTHTHAHVHQIYLINHISILDLNNFRLQKPFLKKMKMLITKLLHTAQRIKFFIKDFLYKCQQIHNYLLIWSHLLKNSLMEN